MAWMRMKDYCVMVGISPNTASKWLREGRFPHEINRVSRRAVFVNVPDRECNIQTTANTTSGKTVAYIRVSGSGQESSLVSQELAILRFAQQQGIVVDEIVKEIGSGLNEKRAKLNRILKDGSYTTIICEHRDRLTRSNYRLIESTLYAANRKILLVNPQETDEDLVAELSEFLVSKCASIYGKRGARKKVESAVQSVVDDVR